MGYMYGGVVGGIVGTEGIDKAELRFYTDLV